MPPLAPPSATIVTVRPKIRRGGHGCVTTTSPHPKDVGFPQKSDVRVRRLEI